MTADAAAQPVTSGEDTNPATAPVLSRTQRVRQKLEAIKSWWYLIPLAVAFAAMLFYGVSQLIIAAYLVGCLVWAYWGRRMAIQNPHYVICIGLTASSCRIIRTGRKYWADVVKHGRPWMTLTTATGWQLEVARDFNPDTKELWYPEGGQYSDAAIASIPARYKDLIAELVTLRTKLSVSELEKTLEGQRIATDLVQRYHDLFVAAMTPAAAAKPATPAPAAAAPVQQQEAKP